MSSGLLQWHITSSAEIAATLSLTWCGMCLATVKAPVSAPFQKRLGCASGAPPWPHSLPMLQALVQQSRFWAGKPLWLGWQWQGWGCRRPLLSWLYHNVIYSTTQHTVSGGHFWRRHLQESLPDNWKDLEKWWECPELLDFLMRSTAEQRKVLESSNGKDGNPQMQANGTMLKLETTSTWY